MKIDQHPNFVRHFKERIRHDPRLVVEFKESLALFLEAPSSSALNDHELKEDLAGYRSFSITEDIRVVYQRTKEGILLYDIGNHPQVY